MAKSKYGSKSKRGFPANDPGCDPVQRKWQAPSTGISGGGKGKGAGLGGASKGVATSGKGS
tara:strand:- start:450 stop:632 length:183 start_codon:yes stop_codon:yes gene_type:complete